MLSFLDCLPPPPSPLLPLLLLSLLLLLLLLWTPREQMQQFAPLPQNSPHPSHPSSRSGWVSCPCWRKVTSVHWGRSSVIPASFFFFLFMTASEAYGSSWARGWIGAAAATYTAASGSTRSLTYWARPGIKPVSSRQHHVLNLLSHNGNFPASFYA